MPLLLELPVVLFHVSSFMIHDVGKLEWTFIASTGMSFFVSFQLGAHFYNKSG